MKNKILLSIMTFVMAFFMVSCSDEDYKIPTQAMISDDDVVTEVGSVTSTSATLQGYVKGLTGQAESSYKLYFMYGYSEDNLTETVDGSVLSNSNDTIRFIANLSGTPGQKIYYKAFVSLQDVKTYQSKKTIALLLTDVQAITYDPGSMEINACTAKLTGGVANPENLTENATAGIAISCNANVDSVRNGVKLDAKFGEFRGDFTITAEGLLPNTTYYYTSYVDLGGACVYGEVKSFTTAAKTYDADNDFVDLGLSTKWAKCNLGADNEYELGGLFGFGDLKGYNTSIDPEKYASADIYKTTKDLVYNVYDGLATMPTIDEIQELFDCCNVEWTTMAGVSGYKFTSKSNGNSIFMPAAGSRVEGTVTGEGTEGRYMTGSINSSDTRYAQSFIFTQSGHARTTTPVYQALSVRPVTVAKKVAFNKDLFYKTWEIDLVIADDGTISSKKFKCPTYFYASQASWRSITNNEPVINSGLDWAPDDFGSEEWAFKDGYSANRGKTCQGYITFNADGTVKVKHYTIDESGAVKETEEEGTFTLDEANKSVKLNGVTMLTPQFSSTIEATEVRILSLTESTMQMSVTRDDGEQLSINMIPQLEKYGYPAALTCYGPTTDDSTEDQWSSATLTIPGGESALGTYTITFNTTHPRSAGQVYILDIDNFAAAYPNAFVRIDKIEADGVDVPFDANKFFYGNIEGGGKFRVEMANIWGKGHNDGWNGLKDTPFHKEGGETTNETALAFNKTFAVTFTIVSLDANLSFTAKQTCVALEAGWALLGNWGVESPGAIKVNYNSETCQYELANTNDLSLSMSVATDCGGTAVSNGAVNLVDIIGIRQYFPGFGCELKSVVNDGNNVAFLKDKIKYGDIENNGNFRIELHNIWGSGTANDPAFGGSTTVEGNNCVTSLGFSNSSVYTIGNFTSLFAKPW